MNNSENKMHSSPKSDEALEGYVRVTPSASLAFITTGEARYSEILGTEIFLVFLLSDILIYWWSIGNTGQSKLIH